MTDFELKQKCPGCKIITILGPANAEIYVFLKPGHEIADHTLWECGICLPGMVHRPKGTAEWVFKRRRFLSPQDAVRAKNELGIPVVMSYEAPFDLLHKAGARIRQVLPFHAMRSSSGALEELYGIERDWE